ncbi:MAG TPA: hypothetical protein VIL48_09630 [Acidimicrobiales bacterium]
MGSPTHAPAPAGDASGAAPEDAPGDPAADAGDGPDAGVAAAEVATAEAATDEAADRGGDRGDRGSATGPAGLSDRVLLAVTAAVTLPVLWMGYGTDLDIGDVRAVGELIRAGDYRPSRNPGVPVFETIVALLDPVGGHIAINLAAAVAAGATVVGVARLVRAWGRPNGDLVGLAFLASPITLIAATSTTDFIFAVAFFVWGALAHLRDRSLAASVLFALAVGSRSSTLILIGALLVADGWEAARRRRCLRTAAVLVPLGVALYVPAWLAFDRTFGFLETEKGWRGLANNLGRFTYKNYAVAGVALVVVAALATPALVRALRRWGSDPMVRFAALAFVATEALFLQLPWKPAHLLPSLLALVLWVAASDRNRRPFLALLVGAIALNGLVAFRPLAPDDPDASTSARFEPALTPGLVVNDIDCRADFMHEDPHIGSGSWECALKPMRGSSADDPTPVG